MNKSSYRGFKVDYIKTNGGVCGVYIATGNGNTLQGISRVDIERKIDKEIDKNAPEWVGV